MLGRIADEKPADAEARITALLGKAHIELNDNMEHAIAHVSREFPGAIVASLMARLAADLPLPYRAGNYLKDAPLVDSPDYARGMRFM